MRPISYDQKQIDDEYCKDRVREADLARMALAAKGDYTPHTSASIARMARLGAAMSHALAGYTKLAARMVKAGRQDMRRAIYWATHLPRHT